MVETGSQAGVVLGVLAHINSKSRLIGKRTCVLKEALDRQVVSLGLEGTCEPAGVVLIMS